MTEEEEEKLDLQTYGNHNGIVITCRGCGNDMEETSDGYYRPLVYESEMHNRACRYCRKHGY